MSNSLDDSQNKDPAERAAQILFRISFGILVILLPLSAVLSRRAPAVIAPIGCIILIAAAFVRRGETHALQKIKASLLSPLGIIALTLFAWSLLSLLWTPFPALALERIWRIIWPAFLTIGVVLMFPAKMRSSNLYLIAFGAGITVTTIMSVLFFQTPKIDRIVLERGTIFAALLAWPAVTYLSLKKRSIPSMAIAGSIGAIVLITKGPIILPALLVGAIILGGALNNKRAAALSLFAGIVVSVLAAPLWAIVASNLPAQENSLAHLMQIWADVIAKDPVRLLTGHGMDASLRNKISPLLEASAPKSLLFETWYDLGLLGAIGLTALLIFTVDRISKFGNAIAPFALGAFGFAFALSVTGLGTSQAWWMTALSMTIIAFAAIINRENSTVRPVAVFAPSTHSHQRSEQ